MPGVGVVDDVVVIERAGMDELDRNACFDRLGAVVRAELGGHLGEQRAVALSAGEDEVLGDLGEEVALGCGDFDEPCFDGRHAVPDAGNRHQFLQWGDVHRRDISCGCGSSPKLGPETSFRSRRTAEIGCALPVLRVSSDDTRVG